MIKVVYIYVYITFGLVMILTFDLWAWKRFQQFSLAWRKCVTTLIHISPLST